MNEGELLDLISKYRNTGISASEIQSLLAKSMKKETLDTLWYTPRRNINAYVEDCLSNLVLEPPFLDLGCGRRSLKPEIMQKYGEQTIFIGIDHYMPPPEGNDPKRLPDIIAEAEDIPLAGGSIGTVFCLELLEHVADEQIVLAEISRVIHPNGNLLLSIPGLDIPNHEKLPFQRDYRRISPEQLEKLLIANGFRNIEIDVKTLAGLQINIFATAKK